MEAPKCRRRGGKKEKERKNTFTTSAEYIWKIYDKAMGERRISRGETSKEM